MMVAGRATIRRAIHSRRSGDSSMRRSWMARNPATSSVVGNSCGTVRPSRRSAAWPGRTDETGAADKTNRMRKYAEERALKDPAWDNAAVNSGEVVGEVSKLQQQRGGVVVDNRGCELVRALIGSDRVDEHRQMVF